MELKSQIYLEIYKCHLRDRLWVTMQESNEASLDYLDKLYPWWKMGWGGRSLSPPQTKIVQTGCSSLR